MALERLEDRALGEHLTAQLARVVAGVRRDQGTDISIDNPLRVAAIVDLAQALYAAGRISTQEFIFQVAVVAEGVHDRRWIDGCYDDDLEPIYCKLCEIRGSHRVAPGDWADGQQPPEYTLLNEEYEAVLRRGFAKVLRDLRLIDIAIAYERDHQEFEKLRERGRRSTFHRNELAPALRDIVIRYEKDARKAAEAQAYSAAVTLLGAGLEGLLILRCLRSKAKAFRIAQQLPKRLRQREDDPTKWPFEALVTVCHQAGWLRRVETPRVIYDPAALAHELRSIRNLVHPGKHAKERPWLEIDARDFENAEAVYTVLLFGLGHITVGQVNLRPRYNSLDGGR